MRFFLLSVLLISCQWAHATQWVKLGEAEISWGYKTPYRINLMAPKGIHDLQDIRSGTQLVQFEIEWLAPSTSQTEIQQHFKTMIEDQLKDPESIKFNQTIINRFLNKLPQADRFDRWQLTYSPDAGTQVQIDGEKVHTLIGSEINRALHHAWMYRDPVTTSKLLTRLLKLGK